MSRDPGTGVMEEPLAYFLTWTTYGSWLPGDERGWVDKPGQIRQADPDRRNAAQRLMTEGELTLDDVQRSVVERTIENHCRIRGWQLYAVNCRRQHVHVVVAAHDRDPEDVMDQFKAWCTRRLKEHNLHRELETPAKELKPEAPANERQNWWTQRGSKRQLFDEASLEAAVHYVLEGQGD